MPMNSLASTHKKPTISDVAKLAKVGKTSVSRYLNGEFDALSERIKAQIELAINILDYRPNQMARSLKRGSSKLIAYLIPDITNPYSVEVMQGLEKACQDNGYTLLVCNTNRSLEKEHYYLQLLSSYSVEGLVFHPIRSHVNSLTAYPYPVVLVDRKIENFSADRVGLDNIQAATLATMHLIDNGFDAILFISEPIVGISSRLDRVNTFKSVVANHHNVSGEVIEITEQTDSEHDRALLATHIAQFYGAHPTKRKAIISINGSLTLEIALALKMLNLTNSQEVGLLGFDDPKWAAVVGDGITSIKQPTYRMGYATFELLLKRINGHQGKPQDILFAGELVIRRSTQSLSSDR